MTDKIIEVLTHPISGKWISFQLDKLYMEIPLTDNQYNQIKEELK